MNRMHPQVVLSKPMVCFRAQSVSLPLSRTCGPTSLSKFICRTHKRPPSPLERPPNPTWHAPHLICRVSLLLVVYCFFACVSTLLPLCAFLPRTATPPIVSFPSAYRRWGRDNATLAEACLASVMLL